MKLSSFEGVLIALLGLLTLLWFADLPVVAGVFLFVWGNNIQQSIHNDLCVQEEIAAHDSEAKKLLDEVRQQYTTDDDLPNNLLPRIDAFVDGEQR